MLRRMIRATNELRPITIERNYPTHAPGSVLVGAGQTRVLCTAQVSDNVPPWLIDKATGEPKRGWVTAEYAMLPAATPERQKRGPNSRATEIKRLIGRSLRAAVNLDAMPGLMITCDCDVLRADGGTRTASITGAFVALADALAAMRSAGRLQGDPIVDHVAAVSVGIVEGKAVLDLDYALDSRAEVDMNVVMNGAGEFIEVQGTGEQGTFSRAQLDQMLDLASEGIARLIERQRETLK